MRKIFLISLLFFVLSCVNKSYDYKKSWKIKTNHIISIFDYIVITPTPKSWPIKPIYEEKDDNLYLVEFIPEGENLENWTRMITVSGYKKTRLNPEQFFASAALMTSKVCGKENTIATKLGKSTENTYNGLLTCKKTPNKDLAKTVFYRIYKDNNSLYAISHSWQGKLLEGENKKLYSGPVSIDEMKESIQGSNSTFVCSKENPKGGCKKVVKLLKKSRKIR